ncbi:hypothetical protein Bbelb_304760 [Branchiostoma belcheri]|nr:hypothetical protein Bbelb_304760 [Branchiostoma belcheri]
MSVAMPEGQTDRKMRISLEKAVLLGVFCGQLLVCAERQDDTNREPTMAPTLPNEWICHLKKAYWWQAVRMGIDCDDSHRRRPLPEFDASAAAEDRFAHRAGDLQEWLSGGTFTLPRETDGDGSGNDRVAAMGHTLRRQILNRIAELKIRSQRPNNEEQ